MFPKSRVYLALALTVVVSGCFVSAATVMNSWVGARDTELVSKWGAPARSITLSDSSRVVTYVESPRCERSFTISRAGVVTAWSSSPDCPKEFRK